MIQRLYIDRQLQVPYPSDDSIRAAVLVGKLVVAVDEAGIPVQITPEMLKSCPSSHKPPDPVSK